MTIDDQVLALLRTGGEHKFSDLVDRFGTSTKHALHRHHLRGDVRRIKRGVWAAVVHFTPAEIRARFKPR